MHVCIWKGACQLHICSRVGGLMYGSTVLPASELQTWAARAKFSRKERPPSIRFVRPGEGKEGFDRGRAAPKGIIVSS